jgi:PhnB protein
MSVEIETRPSGEDTTVYGGVVAYLTVSDADAAGRFYKEAFGAEELRRHAAEDGKRLLHLHLKINGGSLFLMDAFPEWGHPYKDPEGCMLHLQVDDVQAWWDRAVAAGVEVKMELQDMFWGDRYGQFKDPYGVSWSVGAPSAK